MVVVHFGVHEYAASVRCGSYLRWTLSFLGVVIGALPFDNTLLKKDIHMISTLFFTMHHKAYYPIG